MFTLRQPDGPKGAARLRALPDGSVLFTRLNRGPNLWRLYPDGRATRLRWAGTVVALAAERAGTALVVREGRTVIERIHFGARRLSPVADLEGAPGLRRDVLGGGLLLVSGATARSWSPWQAGSRGFRPAAVSSAWLFHGG